MTESSLLPRSACERLFDEAFDQGRRMGAGDIEVTLQNGSLALTRFANNTIHQNIAERSGSISIRVQIGRKTARATTNGWDRTAIVRALTDARTLAMLQPDDPDLLPMAKSSPVESPDRHFAETAATTPLDAAREIKAAVELAEAVGLTAAGVYSIAESAQAIGNSNGVFAYHAETMSQFSITVMGADSSGWAKRSSCDSRLLDPQQLARRAVEKAVRSAQPREMSPGAYTVILEPSAVLDLVGQITGDFSATALHDERSFLTGRMGEQVLGRNITIVDDSFHPGQSGPAFDGEGMPRQRLELVRDGVPTQVAYGRNAAAKAGVDPTGHGFPLPSEYGESPLNVVIAGGNTTLDQMIASAERAILVTRLWYIREVEPYEKVMTGMTRDGTFLVENGNIVSGLRNFRFNESVVAMLNRIEALSPSERASGEEAIDMVVPAMLVRDFPFTEVTKF